MHILHVLPELNRSGAEVMLLTAAADFQSRGDKHSILLVKLPGGGLERAIRDAGYTVTYAEIWKTPLAAMRYARLLKRLDPDVVHVHVEYNHALLCMVPLLQGRGVCRTIHNRFTFSGLHRLRKIAERRILSYAGVAYRACSASVQANEMSHLKLTPEVIDNWFDVEHFKTASDGERASARDVFGIGPGEFVVATVGNCAPQKNHDALIEAMALLPPASNVRLLHAGREDDTQSERALAQKLGVAANVLFVGSLADVWPFLCAADAFVLPSLIEGSSIALLEAASVGMPCIVTNVGLTPEITQLEAVTVIEPTAASIADAIAACQKTPKDIMLRRVQELARYVRARFHPSLGAAEYTRVYYRQGRRARPHAAGPDHDESDPPLTPNPSK